MTALLFLLVFMGWNVPGLFFARAMYADAVRQIRSKPVVIVPPKPDRPEIELELMLHDASPKNPCMLVDPQYNTRKVRGCTCKYRDEWVNLKNEWEDYDEWIREYGSSRNGVAQAPTVNMTPIMLSVPFWPVAAGVKFVKSGQEGIPDYQHIASLQDNLFPTDPLKELE